MTATFYVLNNGTIYDVNGFELKKELERAIDSCDVSIVKTAVASFNVGDEPELHYFDGSTDTELFHGRISDKKENTEGLITIEGFGGIINHVTGEEVYQNKSPEFIAADLIANYTDLTYASTAVSGLTISTFVVNTDLLVDAFKYLLDLMSDWIIRSDNAKNFYFEPRTTTYSSESVVINQDAYLTSEWNRNPDKIINQITLVGDVQTFNKTETFAATASQTVFTLAYKPNGNVKVTDNGTELVGGLSGGTGTYDYVYDAYTNTITFTVGRTVGHSIVCIYSYTIPIKVTAENGTSIATYGTRGTKVTNNNIKTMNDARTWVQNYLDTNSTEDISGEFNVAYTRNINVGEILQVTDTFNNIDQQFIVNAVITKYPEGIKTIKVGKVKFDNLKNQKEVNDRLKKLEQQFDNTTLIQLYRSINEDCYINIDQTYIVKDRSVGANELIWGVGNWGEKQWTASPVSSDYTATQILNTNNVFTTYFDSTTLIDLNSTTSTINTTIGQIQF